MRNRTDSAHVQNAVMKAAVKKINPPDFITLTGEEMTFFQLITRAKLEWTQLDLVMACHLSRCFADMGRLQRDLDRQGYVISGKANPLVIIVETLSRRSLLFRAL